MGRILWRVGIFAAGESGAFQTDAWTSRGVELDPCHDPRIAAGFRGGNRRSGGIDHQTKHRGEGFRKIATRHWWSARPGREFTLHRPAVVFLSAVGGASSVRCEWQPNFLGAHAPSRALPGIRPAKVSYET